MNWDNSEREIQQDSRHRSQMRTAVLVSLLMHGMVLAMSLWLMDQRAQNRLAPAPATVRINLLPPAQQPERQLQASEPARLEQADQTASDRQPASEVAQQATAESAERPGEPGVQAEPLVELPQLATGPVTAGEVEADAERVPAPDALTLRQTVRAISERQRADAALSSCTPAQRRNELFDCLDNGEPDLEARLRNPIYLSFAQAFSQSFSQLRSDDQSRRDMGVIAGNQQQLRAGIQAFSPDGVNNDYLLEELSQGIEVYSATGNIRLERLTDQILGDDPVHQQAKRIMNPR